MSSEYSLSPTILELANSIIIGLAGSVHANMILFLMESISYRLLTSWYYSIWSFHSALPFTTSFTTSTSTLLQIILVYILLYILPMSRNPIDWSTDPRRLKVLPRELPFFFQMSCQGSEAQHIKTPGFSMSNMAAWSESNRTRCLTSLPRHGRVTQLSWPEPAPSWRATDRHLLSETW